MAAHFKCAGHFEAHLSVCVVDRLWKEDMIRRKNQKKRMDQNPTHFVAQGNESMIGRSLTIFLSHAQSQPPSGISTIIQSRNVCHLGLIITLLLCIKLYVSILLVHVCSVFVLMKACIGRNVDD